MSLKGKLVEKIAIKSDADVFLKMFKFRPNDLSDISSNNVHGCDILQGETGTVGSVVSWKYTLDGKPRVAKQLIEAVDDANKSVTYKVIEGHLLEIYNYFIITINVDKAGEINFVTWTFDFEKSNADTPDPVTLTETVRAVTKDFEAYNLKL